MIKLSDIVVKFGDFEALHNINVHVKEGEFFTFLGPSGCGKTTTLRTITGFIEPVGGTVSMQGRDITHVPIEKRNIGIVFQSYALFPTMTVRDNIAFGLKIKKMSKDVIRQKVDDIAKKVDLTEEQLAKAVSQLSGGQQQRVAIARALVTEPAIICMDEPLSNLDAKSRVQLRNELKRMQKDFGITTIYVTHDQEEALILSDRIAVFNKGYIEQIGTPNEIYNHSSRISSGTSTNWKTELSPPWDWIRRRRIISGWSASPSGWRRTLWWKKPKKTGCSPGLSSRRNITACSSNIPFTLPGRP